MRLHAHAQRIFFLVIAEAAPRRRILGEDNRPLILVGKRVQAIASRRQRLPFHSHVVSKRNCRVFIRSGTPHLPIRNRFAPNLPASHRRPVIGNGDVRQPDSLRHAGPLADSRNVQFCRLAAVLELCFRAAGQESQPRHSRKQAQNKLRHAAHNRTILSHAIATWRCAVSRRHTPACGRRRRPSSVSRNSRTRNSEHCQFRENLDGSNPARGSCRSGFPPGDYKRRGISSTPIVPM